MNGRASYSIIKDEVDENGQRSYGEIFDDRIEALTREYKEAKKKATERELDGIIEKGHLAIEEIKADLEKGINRLKKEVPLSAYNLEILEDYIKKKIQIKSANTTGAITAEISHARKCMKLLESNSLKTIDIIIIQNILDARKTEGSNIKLLASFRSLLKFIGRYEEANGLRRKKYAEVKPPYLSGEQVKLLIRNIPEASREKHPLMSDFITLTYNLGTRISETLALIRSSVRGSEGHVVVQIDKQWARKNQSKRDGSDRLRATKNRTVRAVMPLDCKETLRSLENILKMFPNPGEERERYRWAIDHYIRKAAKSLFTIDVDNSESEDFFDLKNLPALEDDRKYRAVHMLRAGHAVEMMKRTGDNSGFVAKQLGDTESVVAKYYAGRTNRPASIGEMAKMIYGKNASRGT